MTPRGNFGRRGLSLACEILRLDLPGCKFRPTQPPRFASALSSPLPGFHHGRIIAPCCRSPCCMCISCVTLLERITKCPGSSGSARNARLLRLATMRSPIRVYLTLQQRNSRLLIGAQPVEGDATQGRALSDDMWVTQRDKVCQWILLSVEMC